ncbi:MAG: GNAT family N-acetyltransferase [Sandaracinaceae bacterium]|nr:GNAT family N-acetyltransferase [Sandaracinaceae bacterium]
MRSWSRLGLGLLLTLASATASAQPPQGAWLRYRYEQRLRDGTGAYLGYSEVTRARARYEVLGVDAEQATIEARYAWVISSTAEPTRTGFEHRTVAFSLANRRYVSRRTDVSDLDEEDGTTLATWIWIPPDTPLGADVEVLGKTFVLAARDESVVVTGEPRSALRLRAAYPSRRDDAYGNLDTRIVDEYWFDAATGMFLRERHVETATGLLEEERAGFTLETTIELVDASYAPAAVTPPEEDYTTPPEEETFGHSPASSGSRTAPPPPRRAPEGDGSGCCLAVIGCGILLSPLLVILLVRRLRPPAAARGLTAMGVPFDVREPASSPVAGLELLSPSFAPFLPHMIGVARALSWRVATAVGPNGQVLGVAIDDPPANIATIFAPDSDVCELLRRRLGREELFSDVRHPALASVHRVGVATPPEAYNVYETFEVLELATRPTDLGYDGDVVDPMRPEDLGEVAALFEAVYGVACREWLGAALAAGDLGWVARVDGRVAGAALATLVGTRARLHGLTVDPEHRGRGLGRALYRARLRGLFDLGAERVLTECATWNLGALDLARAHGFEKVGLMYVESARSAKHERRVVRR